jgi:hypothetical protein
LKSRKLMACLPQKSNAHEQEILVSQEILIWDQVLFRWR